MTSAAAVAQAINDTTITNDTTLTVRCLGINRASVASLRSAMNHTAVGPAWVVAESDLGESLDVAIVLCDSSLVRQAIQRWPHAPVVAFVSGYDAGDEVVGALANGATICLRDESAPLTAAYLRSVARRRGFSAEDENA